MAFLAALFADGRHAVAPVRAKCAPHFENLTLAIDRVAVDGVPREDLAIYRSLNVSLEAHAPEIENGLLLRVTVGAAGYNETFR